MTKSNFIVKLSERGDVDTEKRTVRFVLSSATPDRVNDVIMQDGWDLKNFKLNPVVLWGHDDLIPAIGSIPNIGVEAGQLVGDVKFATAESHPFADTVFRLVADDIIRTGSVGFMPLKWVYNEKRDGFDFEETELLEYSIVNIPMNPDARRRAVKSGIDLSPLDALEAPAELPDFRSTLLEKSAEQRRASLAKAHGRLAMRAAVSRIKTLMR